MGNIIAIAIGAGIGYYNVGTGTAAIVGAVIALIVKIMIEGALKPSRGRRRDEDYYDYMDDSDFSDSDNDEN